MVAEEGGIPITPTQHAIVSDRDFYLPFRQLGPSKRVVLEDPQGPFSPGRLKTRAGFFDALLFRLITQASPILTGRKRVCFGSPEKFKKATEGQEMEKYCNPWATGQHYRFRNIPHVSIYWDRSAGWDAVVDNPKLTLQFLFDWLTGKEGNKTRFFGMGPLVGWLLATDYAYAGLVDMPRPSEVGEIIFAIDAGGKRGLKLLGYDVGTKESCTEAVRLLWDEVEWEFSPEGMMGLDIITLEHALCKFSRLWDTISKVGDSSILHAVFNFTLFLKDDQLDDFT